jgi:hypothetical protein
MIDKKAIEALSIYLAKSSIRHDLRAQGRKLSSVSPSEISRQARDGADRFWLIAEAALKWCERKYQPTRQPKCLQSKPTRANASSAHANS